MEKAPFCSKGRMKKGFWTPEEDLRLIKCIQIHGIGNWRIVPLKAGLLRYGKACRLRWMNYLRPDIKRGHISADEEDLILRLHKLVGNRWSLIADHIPGRTDNEIKNHWNTHLSKRPEPLQNFKKIRRSLLRTEEVHREPMQNSKKINDAYDFSLAFNNVGAAPWSYTDRSSCSIAMPPPFTSAMGFSPGCDSINNDENLAGRGSWSNLQLELMQNFKKINDGYDALTIVNDFSTSSKQISDGYGDHQFPPMPMQFISACFENKIEDVNTNKNLVGEESNMQFRSTLLGAECNIQSPSFRDEIDDVEAKHGKNMVVNPSTMTAECWEPFSPLSNLLNAQNDCTLSV